MTVSRELLLRAAANEAGLPPSFAVVVATECPWLDGTEEVSESLGLELLADQMSRMNLSSMLVEQFLYSFNARVRAVAGK
jgi:hypothetical protein